jgi:tRNA G18 (ribose-2'-O)-methylase SpoU
LADFRTRQRFRLVVLGTDPSNGEKWSTRIHREFAEELVFLGWCTELADYARWLQTASVVISTAQHETFGISIVESVFCGALPLLPRRLSYPELFPPNEFPEHFYSSPSECVLKLLKLLSISADPLQRTRATAKTKHAVARFRWQTMSRVYDNFFLAIADGNGVTAARQISDSMIREEVSLLTSLVGAENADRCTSGDANDTCSFDQVVTKADDPRVALYRPKSLRDHEYQKQLCTLQEAGLEPSLHGGRRAMTRMLEAMMTGSRIVAVSFLATAELAEKVLTQESRTKCQAPVYVADKKVLDTIRGQKLNAGDAILAMVQFPIASPLSDLIANPPILVLEDVRYADNAGSILRTAFCLGISSIVASGTAWAALQDSRSARCSMGTIYFHRFYKADASCSLDSILALIRENGICIYGIEIGQDAVPIEPHGHDRKWAAILGNEDDGLTPEIRKACDKVVFVPQAHGDSINVGHAAAISMFELGRLAPLPNHDGRATCT